MKKSIFNKMTKIAVMLLIFENTIKNKVVAVTPADLEPTPGGVSVDGPSTTRIIVANIIIVAPIIMFVISLIGLIITKFKLKNDSKNKKIEKWKNIFKIVFIISIVILGIFLSRVFWEILKAKASRT